VTEELLSRHEDVPLGRAMPGTMVFLGDERRMPAQGGHRGEILIAGPSVSPGYLAHQELTQDRFFEYEGCRAYATGDWEAKETGCSFLEAELISRSKLTATDRVGGC
jgi:D-alanine--poly(phosphoribitol) ligase subunit 1